MLSHLKTKRGATGIAYGLLVGLISVTALAAITTSGSSVDSLFTEVGTTLDDVNTSSGAGSEASNQGGSPPSGDIGFSGAFSSGSPSQWSNGQVAIDCAGYTTPASGYDAATQDGVYMVDPDGIGTGDPAFPVYCDMTTSGGGWTLVGKQISFENITPHEDATAVGDSVLLDTSFSGSSGSGTIGGLFSSTEVMMWNSSTAYTFLDRAFDSMHIFSNCRCALVETASSVGIPTTYNRFAFCNSTATSGFIIGSTHSGYGGVCGETWCSSGRHGRYNGSCQNGNAGLGDWIMYIR